LSFYSNEHVRIYAGHENGLIRGRDPTDLNTLETFQGHQDFVMFLCLDEIGILFSTGFVGSVKTWDMACRKVSFSLDDRNGSITALAAVNGALFAETREGVINSLSIDTANIMKSSKLHQSAVTS
jgi:WD40 repeat protein